MKLLFTKSIFHLNTLCIALSCLFFSSQVQSQSLPTPNNVLDLSKWSLTLPINSSGVEQMGTKAISIKAAQLTKGYTSKYFYTTPDTGVAFWCPIDGATTSPTSGTNHPRTELIEDSLWIMNQQATLSASLIVNQYPKDTNTIIIGQIHGGGVSSAAPFVMMRIQSGSIIVYVKGNLVNDSGTVKGILLTNVALGKKLNYTISTDGAKIYATASCPGAAGTGSWSCPIPALWTTPTVHFSAGDYVQCTGNSSIDGGLVTFYSLKISHPSPLPITFSPVEARCINSQQAIQLNWSIEKAISEPSQFLIERSTNGFNFSTIARLLSSRNKAYSFIDTKPNEGNNFFRIKQTDISGKIQYSKTVAIHYSSKKATEKIVQPNVKNQTITLQGITHTSQVTLFNQSGKILLTKTINEGTTSLPFPNSLQKGIYFLKIEDKVFKLINVN